MALGLISLTSFAGNNEARLLRFPTTNGKEIVFSYAGDLYKVPIQGGEAVRMTAFLGYEMFPRFSPDGQTIAFTGQYDGNTEVYTIPIGGGEPTRITYTSLNGRDFLGDRMGPNNIVMCWSPDGNKIVFRNRIGDGFIGRLRTVSKDGGLSEEIPLPEGGFCSYSPDGKRLAYNRVMREFRTWKYYKGGMADDVWIFDPQKKNVTNITDNPSQDIFPMWIGSKIYFLSDRDRTMNIFVYDTQSAKTEKITNFTEYDVKFPSANGNLIVFENAGYIYKLDTNSGKVEKVNITLTSDGTFARNEIKDGSKYLDNFSLNSDGSRLAITARGEIFNVPVQKGVTKNLTRTPGVHEREAEWSPDGKNIAYISDATGENEIYLQNATGTETKQITKGNDTYLDNLMWSPDSKKLVFSDKKNRIRMIDVATGSLTTIMQDSVGTPRDVEFSPDSRWLTYTRNAQNNFSIVYVRNLENGKEYPITDKWYDSGNPVFSTDGKYLIFSSARDFNPTYGSLEWNHVYNNMNCLYIALLTKDTPSPFLEKDGESKAVDKKKDEAKPDEKAAKGKKASANSKDSKDKKTETVAEVKIDPDGISERILRLPINAGYYGNVYSDGKKIWYSTMGGTKVYDLNKLKEDNVSDARMTVDAGSKKAIFFKGRNTLYVTDIPQGKVQLDDAVDLSDMKINVDYSQEWPQVFNEVWRAYRDGYYQETMHGVDWKAMREKYAVLVPYIKNRTDLNYVIGEMIGELCSGHAYVSGGEPKNLPKIATGLLGAEVTRDNSGFFRIEKILEGASWSSKLKSPLREPGIKAAVGDYIVAIDGIATNSVKDMYSLLVGKADVATELSLNDKASLDGARKVVISPIDDEYPLYHYEWVQNNIKKVEKASGGKIGYIYIPDMGVDGLNEFSRYFYPQLDKEGLIVDDRANGGGNVSPMILERLARQVYRVTMGRGTNHIGTVPDATLVGPKVCLINKYSASDGDLFPWGFKALNLGKLIGTRTWGGIIGISGSLPYMDETSVNIPFFTSYDYNTGKWIIENHGVDPDIIIDNDPIKEYAGEDQQLDKAIEEVMSQLKDRKPLPPVPAPRNFAH